MDFAPTEEQQAILAMAREVGAEHIAPHARAWEAAGTIPRELWPKLAAVPSRSGMPSPSRSPSA